MSRKWYNLEYYIACDYFIGVAFEWLWAFSTLGLNCRNKENFAYHSR